MNFIDVWLRLLDQNGEVRCGMNNRAMKNIFQTIPTINQNHLVKVKKYRDQRQKLVVDCKQKNTKGIPPLRRPKIGKNYKRKMMEF